MKTKKSYGFNMGASSILVIIVILCLVCFAGLSMASASADYRLSQKLAQRTTAYYEAGNEAQLAMAELSGQLSEIYAQSSDRTDYEKKIKESLTEDSFTFSISMNDNQSLKVSISPLYSETKDGDFLEITCWQIINFATPELDQSLPVFLGD